jgi:biotin carboxylase
MTQPHLQPILGIIEQSLGPQAALNRLTSRTDVLAAAAASGVAVPPNARIASSAERRPADFRAWFSAWFSANGLPAYLKADGTSGGIGIRQVHTCEEAVAALRALDAPPRALRAIKRLAIDRDSTLLGPLIRRERPAISVQRAIAGTEANSAIFCWQGKVLAGIAMQVLATRYQHGPSTVVRRIRNAAMDHAAAALASRLQLSGFYGLDFILDEQIGTAWLIEMNSRATQIAHLALGPGHDLPAAAFAAVTGTPVHPRAVVTTKETIALFPQEWQRDPASSLIATAYHDVPWDVPMLVRAYVDQRLGWRRLLTQHYWRERRRKQPTLEAPVSSEATAPRLP